HWVRGVRYMDDGRFISSAGVTSGIDATLHTVQRFLKPAAADVTTQPIGYPHTRFLDNRTWEIHGNSDVATLPNIFRFSRTQIGLLVCPGVGEIELSLVTDTYPRALATDVLTIGTERKIIRARHGLDLAPRHALESVPRLDRLFIPGLSESVIAAAAEQWTSARVGHSGECVHATGSFPHDARFTDLARLETRLIPANAARWIAYPMGHIALQGSNIVVHSGS
ncbi:MAG: hypothetical protein ACKVVP_14540, partial [Chloroflexota bacterium]